MGTTFKCLIAQCLLITIFLQQTISQPVILPKDDTNTVPSESGNVLEEDPSESGAVFEEDPSVTPSSSTTDLSDSDEQDFDAIDSTPVTETVLPAEDESKSTTTTAPVSTTVNAVSENEPNSLSTDQELRKVETILPVAESRIEKEPELSVPSDAVVSDDNNLVRALSIQPEAEENTSTPESDQSVADLSNMESDEGIPVKIHGTINISAHYGPKTTSPTITKPVVADTPNYLYNTPCNPFLSFPNFSNDYYSLQFFQNFYNYFNNLWNYCGQCNCCSNNYLNTPCNYFFPNEYSFSGLGNAFGSVNIYGRF